MLKESGNSLATETPKTRDAVPDEDDLDPYPDLTIEKNRIRIWPLRKSGSGSNRNTTGSESDCQEKPAPYPTPGKNWIRIRPSKTGSDPRKLTRICIRNILLSNILLIPIVKNLRPGQNVYSLNGQDFLDICRICYLSSPKRPDQYILGNCCFKVEEIELYYF